MLERLRYIDASRLRRLFQVRAIDITTIDKRNLVYGLFVFGLIVSCLSSIHMMYFWPIELICPIITFPIFATAILLSQNITGRIFTDRRFIIPTLLCLVTQCYMFLVNGQNLVPYVLALAGIPLYALLFRLDKDMTDRVSTTFCKTLAVFLCFSIVAFIFNLAGIGLPSTSVVHGLYSYTNYFLFLLDDRDLFSILIPRFNSVFLEPGHLGTLVVLLLATQIGQWSRWYNVVLFIALFLSFSLAAYGLLVILMFLRLWMLRKKIMMKIIILVSGIAIIVTGSYIYNDGDNILNQLIVSRLEMTDDGDDFEGNNRVSKDFQQEFESFLDSDDILFGREMATDIWGNSGYKVFIFDYGFVGVLMFLVFYFSAFRTGRDRRAIISALILAMANFWIRGYAMLTVFVVLYFLIAHQQQHLKLIDRSKEEKLEHE